MFRNVWIFGLALAAATPSSPSAEPEKPVLRITVSLVQVDAVVTDSRGHQVTNLTADDFEILEDDRPQKIAALSYVKVTEPPSPAAKVRVPSVLPSAPLPPSPPLAPQQVRRTFVLMVDDLGLSFESTYHVRRALKKFVYEEMQPGDLVAIIRTSAGMGSLQQFTNDKRILYESIDRVRWFPAGRGGISAFAALGNESLEDASRLARDGRQNQLRSSAPDLRPRDLDDPRNENFMLGTLGAVNFVIRALRDLPGRKALILFSDGIPLLNRGQERTRVVDPLRVLTDLANRAAVVVYTIDARGLQTLSLTAADQPALPSGHTAGQTVANALSERSREYVESQDGMAYLARQTGGFFVHDNNDLSGAVRRVIEDLNGYYLIGYKPEESSFAMENGYRRFHKIQVRVKVAGLAVRSRAGYLGVPDEEARPVHHTGADQLGAALVSPFRSSELKLRLTCLFSEVPKTGAVVQSLVHIDARDLTFTQEPNGFRKTVLDVVAFLFDADGIPASSDGHTGRTATLHFSPADYAQVIRTGLVFGMDVALKKPGAYQVRAAVRDVASKKVGSASQFVEVPDVTKHQLALSGIVLNGAPPATSGASAAGQQENLAIAYSGSPAVRVFQRGQMVRYAYTIFNAQLERKTRHPDLETQLYLYRDSKPLFTGSVTTLRTVQQAGVQRVIATGAIRLEADLVPGEYTLEIVARDKLAPERRQLATQWADLEVEK